MIPAENRIYLASRSPRRRELLAQIGVAFEVIAADVNETPLPNEGPMAYVRRITRIKAEVGWMRMAESGLTRRPVLAADTTVVLGRRILGKPADAADAAEMLKTLSGSRHRVLTAVAVVFEERLELALSSTVVHFRELSDDEIRRYVATGEPMGKAGAYGIQGRAAAFVARIEGSYSGVMGLPLYETAQLLTQFGLRIP